VGRTVRAGTLNARVTIEQPTAGQDAVGQPVLTWTTVAVVWAHVRHRSGMETIRGDADTSVVKASIRIRYKTGLNAGMRVTHGASTYDIRAVLMDVEHKEYTDLVCELAV
jgi:SPP1 family predicted phage head-tail adaptor